MSTFTPPQQGQQQPTEVYTAQVTEIVTKPNDKWVIVVQPDGSQYTRNLWTKDYGLVQQMEQSINQWFDFICRRNHYDGPKGPTSSLWINELAAPGSTPRTAPEQVPGSGPVSSPTVHPSVQAFQTPGQPGISPMEKEERILREHGMNMAVLMLPYIPVDERNLPGLVNVAEGLVRYYKLGRAALAPTNEVDARKRMREQDALRSADAPGYGDEPVYENTPPEWGDDDIPYGVE
jgi:hypothetical protein